MANEEFTKFVNYYVDKSISLIPETGYVPLEKEMYDLIKKRIAEGRTGSVYVGLEKTVGVKLAEVYK